ncbi:hypothetical protein ATANTOWER_011243 [Ataeniobius toweri]|uniref:Uncharacterized protein n=1 Tax=Ataeniobius toweri TaxID=208326 RepID=A0ABU7B8K4_9TELE|nr:hypothetical protein [Ataeniobius toweri]
MWTGDENRLLWDLLVNLQSRLLTGSLRHVPPSFQCIHVFIPSYSQFPCSNSSSLSFTYLLTDNKYVNFHFFFFFFKPYPVRHSELLSECREKAQQIYFHKWTITADALKLCLTFIKRNFIRLLHYSNCYGRGDRNGKEKKEARKRERGAKRKRGEKQNRMEERKKDGENTR